MENPLKMCPPGSLKDAEYSVGSSRFHSDKTKLIVRWRQRAMGRGGKDPKTPER